MCTVSFIPKGKLEFVLTSNRDEAPNRTTLSPHFYHSAKTWVLFPKDELAGGTWIGVSDKNRLVCLLNGGFKAHDRKADYRMSRGIVVKAILTSKNFKTTIENYDLDDIEPFTLVIVEWNRKLKLFEFVWDGSKKHFSELPIAAKLWSSSSLYDSKMKAERQKWFDAFMSEQEPTSDHILDFHHNTEKENLNYGIIMDRGFVKTTSITQVEKTTVGLCMRYHNLQSEEHSKTHFNIPETIHE